MHHAVEARYRDYLSRHKMLFTRERALILRGVYARVDHFSADDLFYHMKSDGLEVSRATLYRNLKLLVDAGLLVEADFGHGHIHYERALDAAPHEHLVCKKCGSVTEVSASKVAAAVAIAAESQGFQVDHHQLRIFGTCAKCLAKKAS